MKLISLNAWGGRLHESLMKFVEKYEGVDLFCFQEIYSSKQKNGYSGGSKVDLLEDLHEILKDYTAFVAPKCVGYDYEGYIGGDVLFGNVTFVRKNITVDTHEQLFEYIEHPNHNWKEINPAKAQLLKFLAGNKLYVVCNLHGFWKKASHKQDLPERLEQSRQLRGWLDAASGLKVICGDFNLLPETESFRILKEGYRDLISQYKITSTRSSHYAKEIGFADYILTSPEITIKDFRVLPDEVSDHLPLFLEFE